MSAEGKALVCSSWADMTRYLHWGTSGLHVDDPEAAGLAPSNNNWTKADGYVDDKSPNPMSWSTAHFAGYYWYLVSWWREQRGIPITIPQYGRMCKDLSNFGGDNNHLFNHLRGLVASFDNIRFLCRDPNGPGLRVPAVLDENSIRNTIINEKYAYLMAQTPEERAETTSQIKEWRDSI